VCKKASEYFYTRNFDIFGMASRQKSKEPSKKRKAESGSEDEESKSELDPTAELPCALDPILLLRTEGIWLGGWGGGGGGGGGGGAQGGCS